MEAVGPLHPGEQARWGPPLQEGPTASRPTYRLIQILRALAAVMVVAHHATIMLVERDHLALPNWIAGSSGVDLFFVISGFVMTISSAPLESAPHPARTFLARRLERIVPLYWIVTTVKVVILLLAPALALNGLGSAWHVASSYLFLPSLSAEGRFEPVVVVGWTLNFEMAFYVLFALALARRWQPLKALAPVLIAVPLIAYVAPHVPLRWLTRVPVGVWFYVATVMWEFLFGMLLGKAIHRIRRVPWGWGVPLVLLGLVPLLCWDAPGVSYWRGLQWGLPALAVVSGALMLEKRLGTRSPRWALELGDASYSIYLVHTFALPAVGMWVARWRQGWPWEITVAMGLGILLSVISGELAYRMVERPLMGWFKGRRRTAVPANG